MDITLYEFKALNEFDEGVALWDYGVHVMKCLMTTYGYSLYQLNDFHVEVNIMGMKRRSKFASFRNYTKLEPYLNTIDISKIIRRAL